MKVLLDTNIIIHRETHDPDRFEIGKLFWWLDTLRYVKYVHQRSLDEIEKYHDERVRRSFRIKLESYNILSIPTPIHPDVIDVSNNYDTTENDEIDTIFLNEVYIERVDMLITEDKKIHRKADELGIGDRVFSIESFIEKVVCENPEFKDYKVLSVRRELFGDIEIEDSFFDSLREDYLGFDKWFNGKFDQYAYVCRADESIVAFLYIKIEREDEPYPDISPTFPRKRRLKIGTFKVELNGLRLGERFLKIIFDNALGLSIDEIYLTTFSHRSEQKRLISLLDEFGFFKWGEKTTRSGVENVFIRDFTPTVNRDAPRTTYPFMSNRSTKWIVSIYPEYHTDLFPDSILRTESPSDYIENEPFRNAISKVFISRSINKAMESGDIVVFYRTGGRYKSVVTTIGIIENIITGIQNEQHFIRLCRKRSVFSDEELSEHWNFKRWSRPFIVNFLYAYSFPKRINLDRLIQLGIISDTDSAPRGFDLLSNEDFNIIIQESESNGNIIVD